LQNLDAQGTGEGAAPFNAVLKGRRSQRNLFGGALSQRFGSIVFFAQGICRN
jgi:hypothetical protein